MSKAFTKEDDSDANVRLDELPQSRHPNLVTPSGLAGLNNRLQARQTDLAGLQRAVADIKTPLAIAVAERDIRFLKERINRAILIDPRDNPVGIVAFGAEVDVITDDDTRLTFRIVGEDEADPAHGLVAPFSPIGVALMGAEPGSTVEWHKPAGTVNLEVVAVRFR